MPAHNPLSGPRELALLVHSTPPATRERRDSLSVPPQRMNSAFAQPRANSSSRVVRIDLSRESARGFTAGSSSRGFSSRLSSRGGLSSRGINSPVLHLELPSSLRSHILDVDLRGDSNRKSTKGFHRPFTCVSIAMTALVLFSVTITVAFLSGDLVTPWQVRDGPQPAELACSTNGSECAYATSSIRRELQGADYAATSHALRAFASTFDNACGGLSGFTDEAICRAVGDDMRTIVLGDFAGAAAYSLNLSISLDRLVIFSRRNNVSCSVVTGASRPSGGAAYTMLSESADCTASGYIVAPAVSSLSRSAASLQSLESIATALDVEAAALALLQMPSYPKFAISKVGDRFTTMKLVAYDSLASMRSVDQIWREKDFIVAFVFWLLVLLFGISLFPPVVMPFRLVRPIQAALTAFAVETTPFESKPMGNDSRAGERPTSGDSLANTMKSKSTDTGTTDGIVNATTIALPAEAVVDVESIYQQRAIKYIRDFTVPFHYVKSSVEKLHQFLSFLPSAVLIADAAVNMGPLTPQSRISDSDFFRDGLEDFAEVTHVDDGSAPRGAAGTPTPLSAAGSTTNPVLSAPPLVVMGADQLAEVRSPLHTSLPHNNSQTMAHSPPFSLMASVNPLLPRVPSPQAQDLISVDDDTNLSPNSPSDEEPDGNQGSRARVLSEAHPASASFSPKARRRSLTPHSVESGSTRHPMASPLSETNSFLNPLSATNASFSRFNRRASALCILADSMKEPAIVSQPSDAASASPAAAAAAAEPRPMMHIPTVMRMKRCTIVYCQLSIPTLQGTCLPSSFLTGIVHQTSQLFLETATKCARAYDGVVTSFGITHAAFAWNAFSPYQFHETRACLCAMHLEAALRDAMDSHHGKITKADVTICVSTGHALVGTCLAGDSIYPVLCGENMTIARLGANLAPLLRATTLIAETTYSIAKQKVQALPRDVIGTDASRLVMYEPRHEVGSASPNVTELQSVIAAFNSAFSQLRQGNYQQAADELERIVAQSGMASDSAIDHTLRVARYALDNPGEMHRLVELAASLNQQSGSVGFYRRLPQWFIHEERLDDVEGLDDSDDDFSTDDRSDTASSVDAPSTEPRPRRISARTDFSADPALRTAVAQRGMTRSASMAATERGPNGESPDDLIPGLHIDDGNEVVSQRRESSTVGEPVIYDDKGERWTRSERILGRGTFGVVRVGLSSEGSLSAMKYIPLTTLSQRGLSSPNPASPPSAMLSLGSQTSSNGTNPSVESALAEVAILSKLRHPSIVGYISCSVQPNDLVVILEYCGGGTLGRLIAIFGALPMSVLQRYARDILSGLNFLHKHGVTHRDLSLNNVLLTIDGECKLSDFGGSVTRTTSAPMATGIVIGTPAYMAPETCIGHISMMSDVWSFGIMLCVMASGRLPYDAGLLEKPVDFLRRLVTDPQFGPEIPPEVTSRPQLLALVKVCLQREVMARPWAESLLAHPFFI
jgi:hypothetical protein